MLGGQIAPQSEVIRAILLNDSPCCWQDGGGCCRTEGGGVGDGGGGGGCAPHHNMGRPSNNMALISSDCGAMRSPERQTALITSWVLCAPAQEVRPDRPDLAGAERLGALRPGAR